MVVCHLRHHQFESHDIFMSGLQPGLHVVYQFGCCCTSLHMLHKCIALCIWLACSSIAPAIVDLDVGVELELCMTCPEDTPKVSARQQLSGSNPTCIWCLCRTFVNIYSNWYKYCFGYLKVSGDLGMRAYSGKCVYGARRFIYTVCWILDH